MSELMRYFAMVLAISEVIVHLLVLLERVEFSFHFSHGTFLAFAIT